jgi:serine-type D-Ala-D-Ala carboxypeptidase
MPAFTRAQGVVDHFVAEAVAPCAVAEVGGLDGPVWRTARGRVSSEAGSAPANEETVFDLASLTKVLATATVAIRLVQEGRLDLGARVADLLPGWRGNDRAGVTVSDLLTHASGLPGHRPLYASCSGRTAFERAICGLALEYPPGTSSIYSDLGFILLGFILEDAGRASLDRLFEQVLATSPGRLEIGFGLAEAWRQRLAPSTSDSRRRGTVNDRNADALGGVAGHAGLFGTAGAIGELARAVLAGRTHSSLRWSLAPADLIVRFTTRAGPISSRALAWDTMLPTSSCGTRMSAQAFGHTGFTGASLWIDPVAATYVVLLTNRLYPEPGPQVGIAAFRRALHDAVMEEFEGSP